MQEPPKTDPKNLIMAIALSLAVLMGWQILFVKPELDAQQAQLNAQLEQAEKTGANSSTIDGTGIGAGSTSDGTALGALNSQDTSAVEFDRDAQIANGERVAIETQSLKGTINLVGGKIDDLILKKYDQTIEADSEPVVLLEPTGTAKPYFTELGFYSANRDDLPGPNTNWKLQSGDKLTASSPITLVAEGQGATKFERTISIDDDYMINVKDVVSNESAERFGLQQYGRISRTGIPKTDGLFILHEGLLGMFGDAGFQEASYSDIEDEGTITSNGTVNNGWLGITDKYWGTALLPKAGTEFTPTFRYSNQSGPQFQTDYLTVLTFVEPGATHTFETNIFAGAKVTELIDTYEAETGVQSFDLMIDWGWFYFITKPLFSLIHMFHGMVGNFGVAILLTTVAIKIALFWFANKSYASMAKMKNIQPQMLEIREKFADDRTQQQQEMMKLYRDEKINPAAGCWPMLIQIPVFFALYKVLYVTIEMRHAPFFGWIQDLAAPDPTSIFNLFGLLPWDPGVITPYLMIGVWPLLMGITMFLQMRMNPLPPDPTQKLIFTWMPVIFTFMLATFPAGLVIYWTWNNLLSILQQGVIMKRHGTKIELLDNVKSMFTRSNKDEA